VTVAPVAIPLWADLAAVAIASMQGAIFAAKVDNHRIDLLGVGVVGTATGLGGAFIRDILLNVTPAVLTNNWYLPIAVVASLVGMVLVRLIARLEPFWVVLDALTVGLYAAIGMTKALGIGLPLLPAMFVGVTAAVGGSALRDMLLAMPVAMLKVGTLYAVAAIAGTIALAASLACTAHVHVAAVVCALVTTAVRMCAVWLDWSLPEQRSWTLSQRRSRR
jgi:uncharacterized membrane protein YeiH